MTDTTIIWMFGCACGFFIGITIARPPRDRDPDWRRSLNHENINRPSGPPPLKFRRSEPVKPQFPPPRIIREDFLP